MNELLLPLVLNAGLLLATSQILNLVIRPRLANAHRLRQVAAGVLIGLAGVGVMMFAIEWRPGLVFDLRSVLLAASGLFFGAVPTVVAMLLTASYRVLVGGAGVLMGVAVIFSSGLLGLAWLAVMAGMAPPRHLTSEVVALDGNEQDDALDTLMARFADVAGVEDVLVVPEERLAYLKVDRQRLDEQALARLTGSGNHHSGA